MMTISLPAQFEIEKQQPCQHSSIQHSQHSLNHARVTLLARVANLCVGIETSRIFLCLKHNRNAIDTFHSVS